MPRKRRTPEAMPLMEALQRVRADSHVKSAALKLLRTDLSRIRSPREFRECYSGLFYLSSLIGPLGPDYVRALRELRRALDAAYAHFVDSNTWLNLTTMLIGQLAPLIDKDAWDTLRPGLERILSCKLPQHPKEKETPKPSWKI